MKKVLGWALVLAVVSLGLVGCLPSQAGDQPATAEPAVTLVQDAETEPAAEATPAATAGEDVYSEATAPGDETDSVSDVLGEGRPVIVYGRSGGIAGIMETYEIYLDGRVVFTEKGGVTELRVPAEEVKALLTVLEQLNLRELTVSRPSALEDTGADRFTYTLTLILDGKPIELTLVEGATEVPPALLAAIGVVQEAVRRAQK